MKNWMIHDDTVPLKNRGFLEIDEIYNYIYIRIQSYIMEYHTGMTGNSWDLKQQMGHGQAMSSYMG
jgi:hypothetical protein